MRLLLVALVLLLLCAGPLAAQSLCRYYLAEQYDWTGNRGFYLDFEGSSLATLPLILGVADGAGWRFPQHTPGFAFDTDYTLRAVISPSTAQLSVDGMVVAESPGAWLPAGGSLTVNDRPSWASEPGDWMANVTRVAVSVTRGGSVVESHEFLTDFSARPIPVQLFEPSVPESTALDTQAGDTVTIEVTLRFVPASDPLTWAPIIDVYGQCIYADWPDKVTSDADLQADIAAEDARLADLPPSPYYDQYGGYLLSGWREAPTGYYRVVQRDGFWWLITPEGNPCFYLGLSVAPASDWPKTPTTGREALFAWLPPTEAPWAGLWGHDVWGVGEDADYVALQGANLIRKYGDTWWDDAIARYNTRLRAFGFSGSSKWGAPAGTAVTPVLGYGSTPKLVHHIDVFDPAVRAAAQADLAAQVSASLDDPFVIGWSVGSEREELIKDDEAPAILLMASTVPAKRALLDYAVDTLYGGSVSALASAWGLAVTTREQLYAATPTPPAADAEQMRLYYADRYYAFNYATMKTVDPNHLYFGCYVCPFCADTEEDIRRVAAHCDVMSWDIYTPTYGNERFARLSAEFGKPAFIGEFSYPAFYQGTRGFGRYGVYTRDDADAGEKYRAWVEAATADPRCVGGAWFEYKDQPLTGRGSGYGPDLVYGEHYAFGVVTQTDRVKWELATRMRATNLAAATWRFAASGRPFPDVPPDYWAAGEIGACAAADIVRGNADGTYGPLATITRDQMAVYLARALAGGDEYVVTPGATHDFPDVPAGHWAYRYVEYCCAEGVVQGSTDGRYHPLDPVDRAQMAVFLARARCGSEETVPTGPATATFPDVADSFWAYDHIQYIASAGVTQGYEDGRYHPEYACLRDQMAVYVARGFELVP